MAADVRLGPHRRRPRPRSPTRAWLALEYIDKTGNSLRHLHQYEGRYGREFLRNRKELLALRRARLKS